MLKVYKWVEVVPFAFLKVYAAGRSPELMPAAHSTYSSSDQTSSEIQARQQYCLESSASAYLNMNHHQCCIN
jgi:hypothetical protein